MNTVQLLGSAFADRCLLPRTVRWALVSVVVACAGLSSVTQARATVLGLGDGTYNVTLACITTNCPFTGTMTIAGSNVIDWSFSTVVDGLPAETFTGNPIETFFGPVIVEDLVAGPSTPLGYELVLRSTLDWNVNVFGVVLAQGSWTATLQDGIQPVPLPPTLALFGGGILFLATLVAHRKQKRVGRISAGGA
ncbi:MAG TPA: hypothetical protein VM867_06540 [Xanthobacteraceae bacterium]|nr:hypothetical protein [Xanthobacteraceae bacterium]